MVSLADFRNAPALLVIFMCNHCPYVIHIRAGIAQLARDYAPSGVAIVGINSNDVENYPDDSPAKMKDEVKRAGYIFPYLYDELQKVAKNYHAACTPDIFFSASIKNSLLADNSTTVGRVMAFPSPEKIYELRLTRRACRKTRFPKPKSQHQVQYQMEIR